MQKEELLKRYVDYLKVGDLYFLKERCENNELPDCIKLMVLIDFEIRVSEKNPHFYAVFLKMLDVERERLYEPQHAVNKEQRQIVIYMQYFSNLDLSKEEKEKYITTFNWNGDCTDKAKKLSNGAKSLYYYAGDNTMIYSRADVEYNSHIIENKLDREFMLKMSGKIHVGRFDSHRALRYNESEDYYYFS